MPMTSGRSELIGSMELSFLLKKEVKTLSVFIATLIKVLIELIKVVP
jgi:hypothetical protein